MHSRFSIVALLACSILAVCPSPAAPVSLARGPYVQNNTPTSAIVVWKQQPAAACVLEYGETISYGSRITLAADTLLAVTVSGLQPATRYFYRVTAGGEQLAGGEDYWFETAALSGPVRLLIFGDSGKGSSEQWNLGRRLNSLAVDLMLHVGDVVYPSGEEKNYDSCFFRPYFEGLRHAPIFPVLGNHDIITAAGAAYFADFYLPTGSLDGTERNYSFDWGDAHFVAINSNSITSALANWLAADLAASSKPWKFVYYHHAAYSCGMHGSSSAAKSYLVPVCEAQHVDVVFCGHDHDYQRSFPLVGGQTRPQMSDPDYVNPAGPVYIVTGGGGDVRPTSSTCTFTDVAVSRTHLTRVQVSGDLLSLEAIDSTGTRFDRMTIRKTASPSEPFVRLLSGAGRERWRAGRTYAITWAAKGITAAVDLELSRDGGTSFEPIVLGAPNSGSYSWKATGPGSSDCRLRLSASRADAGGSLGDVSAAPIVIEAEETLPAEGEIVRAYNFQAVTQTAPAGYVADVGALYTPERGYGWSTSVSTRTRGVNSDPLLDSNAWVANEFLPAVWLCDLPNGTYYVTLAAGDPSRAGLQHIEVNGTLLLDDVPTTNSFVTARNVPIEVTDGQLAMTLGGTGLGSYTSVCYLEVRRYGALPPTATASATPTSGEVPLAVAFVGQASAGTGQIVGVEWLFDDGARASSTTAQHTYTVSGTYMARFTVTDEFGRTGSDSVQVAASAAAPPTVGAAATPLSGYAPLAVTFTGTASDQSGIASRVWRFGDGDSALAASASHTYASPGTYTAIFEARDTKGLSARDSVTITVRDPASDTAAPSLATQSPAPGATGVAVSTPIVASLVDRATGVSATSVVLLVDGTQVTPVISGSADSLVVSYAPSGGFAAGATVSVALSAADRAPTPNRGSWSWSFTTSSSPPVLRVAVNFQPASFATPAGYVPDSGRLYSGTTGYGWDKLLVTEVKTTNTDPRLNTYVYVTSPASALWELALANGTYLVTLVVGSPTFTGQHRVELEGTLVVNNVSTNEGQFYTVDSRSVTVADGRLSVRIGGIAGSTKKTKLCYLIVQGTTSGSTNHAPAASAAALPTSGTAPLSVAFTATASDADGDALTYSWLFGDGGSATTATASHTYTVSGTYDAILAVRDPSNASACDTVRVMVSRAANAPPTVTATGTPTSGTAPLTVNFTASGSDPEGGSLRFLWRFGDGDSSTSRNVTHSYASAGTYAAIVIATDSLGAAGRDTVDVQVASGSGGRVDVARVNFQPASFATPAGYVPDSGRLYSGTTGYGWDKLLVAEVKTTNTDPRLNTYVYVTSPAAALWELALANGTYLVTLVVGSPTFTGQHRVELEGTLVVNNVNTNAGQFYTVDSRSVTVADGRLSVRIGGIAGSTKKTKLCYIVVTPAGTAKATATARRAGIELAPNPANPGTVVRLVTSAPTQASVAVFDVRGRLLRTLHTGVVPAGDMRFFWDGRDEAGQPLPSGVYIVRALLAERRYTLKLTLVR